MASRLISELTAEVWNNFLERMQKIGFQVRDLETIYCNTEILKELFQISRDNEIYRDNGLALQGRKEKYQKEIFEAWNKELRLGIHDDEFDGIPSLSASPEPTIHSLYLACLIYDFGDPLINFLNGLKILDHVLRGYGGQLKINIGCHSQDFKNVPDQLDLKIIRPRSSKLNRGRGFHWIVIETGRNIIFDRALSKMSAESKCCRDRLRQYLQERDKSGEKNIGAELPYALAMHTNWLFSIDPDNITDLFPAPLALDFEVSPHYEDFSKEIQFLYIRPWSDHRSRNVFGSENIAKPIYEVGCLSQEHEINDILVKGYGVSSIKE